MQPLFHKHKQTKEQQNKFILFDVLALTITMQGREIAGIFDHHDSYGCDAAYINH
jgi:hypothetical protein